MRWRVLNTPPMDGATNMAIDVALMDRAREAGEAVLRVYAWSTPTLSLGRNQLAVGRYDADRIRARGLDVVRRPTGGRALLHWREVTYSVTKPCAASESLTGDYARINRMLVAALAKLGVECSVAEPPTRARAPDAHPCFSEPSTGEIVVMENGNPRKLVGSAQLRDGGALLQHGSILIDDDQAIIPDLVIGGAAPTHPATLRGLLGYDPGCDQISSALFDAVRECEDADASALDLEPLRSAANERVEEFRDPQWTWRR